MMTGRNAALFRALGRFVGHTGPRAPPRADDLGEHHRVAQHRLDLGGAVILRVLDARLDGEDRAGVLVDEAADRVVEDARVADAR